MGIAITLFILEGCSSSSPRFGSDGKKSARKETGSNHGPRFASKEAEEEVKETDKKTGCKRSREYFKRDSGFPKRKK